MGAAGFEPIERRLSLRWPRSAGSAGYVSQYANAVMLPATLL